MTLHSHECRRCGGSIPCIATSEQEPYGGCALWNGDNDGCIDCIPHSADCGSGYRCPECYAAAGVPR